jgi:hypothetical protein
VRFVFLLAVLARVVHAEPTPEESVETEPPVSAQDVRGAPVPGEESGRTDREPGPGVARRLGRALLWIPRLPIEIAAQPVRAAIYAQDRYSAGSKVRDSFKSEGGHVTVFPTALFETGFGLNIGARATLSDVIDKEHVAGRVALGGQFRFIADLGVSRRFGPALLTLDGRRESRDNERFFGYGNSDEITPSMLVDPFGDEAVATRYRAGNDRLRARLRWQLPANLGLTMTAAVVHREASGTMDEESIDAYFDTTELPGFADDTLYLHDELELAWDTRRRASKWDSHGIRSSGALVLGFAGYQRSLGGEPDLYRFGIDLQKFIRLTEGPRVLELRFYGEAVSGKREEIPFTELPRLGGPDLLRGYQSGRFRDKVSTVAQVRYTWATLAWLAPSLFVDAGRVHPSLGQLSLEDVRVGFGGGVDMYSRKGLVIRAELATSIDRGVLGFVSLQPAFDSRSERM